MTFEAFKRRVSALVSQIGGGMQVRYSTDEHGLHKARFSDGTEIRGNASCVRVEIRWGSGHKAYAEI